MKFTQPILGPMTVAEYAQLWKVSRATCYVWLRNEWLGSVKIGRTRRILPEHHEVFKSRCLRNAYANSSTQQGGDA